MLRRISNIVLVSCLFSVALANTLERRGEQAASEKYNFKQTDEKNCIKTTAEYVRVFREGTYDERLRCVDDSIMVTLKFGRTEDEAIARYYDNLASRDATFWSTRDGPEKYLRIGDSPAIGDFVNVQLKNVCAGSDKIRIRRL